LHYHLYKIDNDVQTYRTNFTPNFIQNSPKFGLNMKNLTQNYRINIFTFFFTGVAKYRVL